MFPNNFTFIKKKKIHKVNLESPIVKYLTQNEMAYEDAIAAAKDVNSLREKLMNCTENESGANILQLYYKYLAFINSIEMRIPISESEVRIPFAWSDIFKGKKVVSYSLAYEKSCVYFNIGAHYTIEGQREFENNSEDSLKNASKNFQMAATAFNSIIDIIANDPSSAIYDLSVDCIKLLVNLCLAQAQECFYQKATKLTPKILAQLAYQISIYYNIALQSKESLKSFISNSLISYIELKSKVYTALTYYNIGVEKGNSSNYGEQVAFLRIAYTLLATAKKANYTKHVPNCKEMIETLSSKVENEYASAKRDNDKIYYDVVPDNPNLKEVSPKSMVKMIELSFEQFNDETDPFSLVVPPQVRKYDSIYSEKKAEILRDISQKIEELNSLARKELYSMGLPGSIESVENPTGVPDSLIQKIKIVTSEGGISMLQDRVTVLQTLAKECSNLLNLSITELDKEEAEDNQMRSIYKQNWTRSPSHTLTMNIRDDLSKISVLLDTAKKSDSIVMSKVEAYSHLIKRISESSIDEIAKELPNINSKKDPIVVNKLRNYILQLTSIFKDRETILSDLRQKIQEDNITSKLMKNLNIIETELEKYESFNERVSSSMEAQNELLKLIRVENQKFVEEGNLDELERQRQSVLQKYEQAFKTYLELKAHFKEGIEFYTKQADKLENIKNRSLDFCLARRTEKEDHVNSIKYYMEKDNLNYHNIYSPQQGFNSNNPFNY